MELEQDYFSLLGVPKRYSVDKKLIKSNARKLLRQYHPDRFSSATPEEQRLAVQLTAHINLAVSVLEDPIKRAQHLLESVGINADFENRTISDHFFLMQQMELREQFDDVMENNGIGIEALQNNVEKDLAEIEKTFSEADFENGQVEQQSNELLAGFSRLHFFIKLQADIKSAARSFS